MPTPQQIAAWRLEQILPFVDSSVSRDERRRAMRQITRTGVHWPSDPGSPTSNVRWPIPRSTIHRWVKAYRSGGLKGLEPKLREDFGEIRREDAAPWVHRAIQLLYELPERSLTQLEFYLGIEFQGYRLSRSTLHRHILRHPAYPGIKALQRRRPKKRRGSYEAKGPHECWQLDGKGPFPVLLMDGTVVRVHVLSVIDDYSRAILAAVVSAQEDTNAAIRVFRMAVERHGLPDRIQFDRGSAFDSHAFRAGLALCGIHRNRVMPRNPEAQGKIEAYHQSLGRWFVNELKAQQVLDRDHLQQLLEAMIGILYNRHHHREIETTPEKRLADKVSDRRLAPQDLQRAFFIEITKSSDPKTGAVKLPNGAFRVPLSFAGKRSRFFYDPVSNSRALLITRNRQEIELEVFSKKPLPKAVIQAPKCGVGQLQKLLDVWQGKERPIAQPGFGLPEVFDAIGQIVGRSMPSSEQEANQVLAFYRRYGPLAREDFEAACEKTTRALGSGRPISAYLADLERQINWHRTRPRTNKETDV